MSLTRFEIQTLARNKAALRVHMRKVRASIPTSCANAAATRISHSLAGCLAAQQARHVALYASMRNELPTHTLAQTLVNAGIALAFPRVVRGTRVLAFHLASLDALRAAEFGQAEPIATMPTIDANELDATIVPGLAFDAYGGRLGWGKGYYDTTLASAPAPLRIGICFAAQLVEIVPTSPHDVSMDYVMTETVVHRREQPRSR